MGEKIIDSISSLVKMSRDELDEALLSDKYNKANLRELIRRLVLETRNYQELFLADYTGIIPKELSQAIMRLEAVEGVEDSIIDIEEREITITLNSRVSEKLLEDIKEMISC